MSDNVQTHVNELMADTTVNGRIARDPIHDAIEALATNSGTAYYNMSMLSNEYDEANLNTSIAKASAVNAAASAQNAKAAVDQIKAATVNFTGATELTDGTAGLVPKPKAGFNTAFLTGDGTWTKLNAVGVPMFTSVKNGIVPKYNDSGTRLYTDGWRKKYIDVLGKPAQCIKWTDAYYLSDNTTVHYGYELTRWRLVEDDTYYYPIKKISLYRRKWYAPLYEDNSTTLVTEISATYDNDNTDSPPSNWNEIKSMYVDDVPGEDPTQFIGYRLVIKCYGYDRDEGVGSTYEKWNLTNSIAYVPKE